MGLFETQGPPDVQKMKAKRDIKGLIKALSYDTDVTVQGDAAIALGKLRVTQAIESLVALLDCRSEFLSWAVAEALSRLDWQPGNDETGACYWLARGRFDKCTEIGLPAEIVLRKALNNPDERIRKKAAEALEAILGEEVYPD